MNNYYEKAYNSLLPHRVLIENKIIDNEYPELKSLLYKILSSGRYPQYFDSLLDMADLISYWSQSFSVKAQKSGAVFRNDSQNVVYEKLANDDIESDYFHVFLNSRKSVENNRRIVINVENQESAGRIMTQLVNSPIPISATIREAKVYLTARAKQRVKHDKIVIYYRASKIRDQANYFDENGQAILDYLGDLDNPSNELFPFYYVLEGNNEPSGFGFGDKTFVLPGENKSRSFSTLRSIAMARGLITLGEFPDSVDDFVHALEEPFLEVHINPELPYLNI